MGVITIDDYDFTFLLFENDVDLDLGNLNIHLSFLLNLLFKYTAAIKTLLLFTKDCICKWDSENCNKRKRWKYY